MKLPAFYWWDHMTLQGMCGLQKGKANPHDFISCLRHTECEHEGRLFLNNVGR